MAAAIRRGNTVNRMAVDINFEDADENHDGVMDFSEFKKIMKRKYQSSRIHQASIEITDDEIKSAFEELDADESGKINRGEFDVFQKRYADGAIDEVLSSSLCA